MGFIAKSIIAAITHQAPKEYESISVIISARPKGDYEAVALHELDKSNIVAWYVKDKGEWRLASAFFVVTKERIIHARGARYTKEKEVFVKKYYDRLLDCIITRKFNWKQAEALTLIRLAQDEVGYSPVTALCDVWHAIDREFMKQYKSKKVGR